MNIIESTKKAKVLIEALDYIQRFKNSTFVIKYGGAFMDDPDPEKKESVARDIAFLASVGIKVVVVHGGGKAISRAMAQAGLVAEFKNGMRVTDRETVAIVEDTLNNKVNAEICDMIKSFGVNAKSIKGNTVLKCEKLYSKDEEGNDIDLGFVGQTSQVDKQIIIDAIADGSVAVVSPIALGEKDYLPYNTNADVAASAVAASLKSRRLVFLCDVAGLMYDKDDASTLIPTLLIDEVQGLKDKKIIQGGMLPKVDSGVKALKEGVKRVHFIDGYMPHSMLLEIFTNKGVGTEIIHEEKQRR
ncbi:MAG: acetylglutamate kinase [Opitutales bacterium]